MFSYLATNNPKKNKNMKLMTEQIRIQGLGDWVPSPKFLFLKKKISPVFLNIFIFVQYLTNFQYIYMYSSPNFSSYTSVIICFIYTVVKIQQYQY